jgi:hypothetical protein
LSEHHTKSVRRSLLLEMTHYPREIAREIEIDKNFNLDRAIYTLSKFLSIEIETAILVAGWLYIQSFYLDLRRQTVDSAATIVDKLNIDESYFVDRRIRH